MGQGKLEFLPTFTLAYYPYSLAATGCFLRNLRTSRFVGTAQCPVTSLYAYPAPMVKVHAAQPPGSKENRCWSTPRKHAPARHSVGWSVTGENKTGWGEYAEDSLPNWPPGRKSFSGVSVGYAQIPNAESIDEPCIKPRSPR